MWNFCEIFLGPMLSPKGFGPRADSGLPIAGQANDGYNENAWMMMISTFYADLLYIFIGFKTKYIKNKLEDFQALQA